MRDIEFRAWTAILDASKVLTKNLDKLTAPLTPEGYNDLVELADYAEDQLYAIIGVNELERIAKRDGQDEG